MDPEKKPIDDLFQAPITGNLLEYGAILWKRKGLIAAAGLIALILAAFQTYRKTPTYTATGTLLIEREEPNVLSFDQVMPLDSYSANFFKTQYRLLQSRSLAAQVMEKLGLQPASADPLAKRALVDSLLGRMKIRPINDTDLVDVSFTDPQPRFAADAVNAIFDVFIKMNIEAKFSATDLAGKFLTEQIAGLRAEIARLEKARQAYGVEKNIVLLNDKGTATVEKLGEMNKALTAAQIEAAQKKSVYDEITNALPESLPENLGSPLIQKLREEYLRLIREYQKKQETFKPDYPEMQRLKAEIETAKLALTAEMKNLVNGAKTDYQAALKRVRTLGEAFNSQNAAAIQMNGNAIEYDSLKMEVDGKKSLLDSLIKRQNETGVSSQLRGLGTTNIRIVDGAEIPLAPSGPNRKRDMLLGLLLGLFVGVALVVGLNYLDSSLKSSEDVEKAGRAPCLGLVPRFAAARSDSASSAGSPPVGLVTLTAPQSNIAENYRLIRTGLLLSSTEAGPKVFAVTSPLPSEGKTTIISNLAVSLTQAGKRVLLIDGDLRKPRQHKIFGIKNLDGLTDYLVGKDESGGLIKATPIAGLFLINSGPLPPNPAELLGLPRMASLIDRWKPEYDFILIDSPPVLAVSDVLVLAPKLDGILLVAWAGKTSRDALRKTRERLDLMGLKTLGVILNRVRPARSRGDYYYHQSYRAGGGDSR
jgi:polysaccharide biosynthesis transport protein